MAGFLPLLLAGLLLVAVTPPAQAGTVNSLSATVVGLELGTFGPTWNWAVAVRAGLSDMLDGSCFGNRQVDVAGGEVLGATFSRGVGLTLLLFGAPCDPATETAATLGGSAVGQVGLPPDRDFLVKVTVGRISQFTGMGVPGFLPFVAATPVHTPPAPICRVRLLTATALRSVANGIVEFEGEMVTTVGAFSCGAYFMDMVLMDQPPGAQGFAFETPTRQQLDPQGRFRIRVHLGDRDGLYRIRIGCGFCTEVPVVPLEVPITAGAAAVQRLEKVAATDGQEGTVGQALDQPFIVQVTEDGTPKTDVPITWAVTGVPIGAAGTVGLFPTAPTTGPTGRAEAHLTLGNRRGTYQVVATCGTCEPTSVTFTATAVLTVTIATIAPPAIQPIGVLPIPGEQAVATVTALVTGAQGRPVAGHPVRWTVEPVAQSGGHAHVDLPRPTGTLEPGCTTGPDGSCTVLYFAGEVGGEELLMANSTLDPMVTDAKVILVRVPRLGPLGVSSAYRLTGQTPEHPDNHNGTAFTVVRTILIALDYLEATTTTLGINDMSLPLGGLFDVSGRWQEDTNFPGCRVTRGHCGHREGKSVDISRFVGNPQDPNDLTFVSCAKDRKLSEIAQKHNATLGCESEGRKHLEFP